MFGEVDCRHRIFSQSKKDGVSIEEGVKRVVNKYFEGLIETIKYFNISQGVWSDEENKLDLKNIIIWGPHPPHRSPNHPHTDVKDCYIINNITKLFNEYLQLKCYEYISVYKSCFVFFFSFFNSSNLKNFAISINSMLVKDEIDFNGFS